MITLQEAASSAGITDTSDWAAVISKLASDGRFTNRTILVPPGDYPCRSTMTFGTTPGTRPICLMGEGPVDWEDAPGRGAVFRWQSTPSPTGASLAPAVVINASSTMLKWLRFQALGPKQDAIPVVAAIGARCVLEDVIFLNWKASTAVISISSDINRAGFTKGANNWTLDRVHVRGVWGPGKGVVVAGGDSNHGLGTQVDVSDVQEGTSIHDGSFLGNTWLSSHVHAGELNKSPPYVSDGRSARTLFLGPYTEGYVQSSIVPPALWVGGLGLVKGGATILAEGIIKNITAIMPTIRTNALSMTSVQRLVRFEFEDGVNPATGKPTYDFIDAVVDYRKDPKTGKFVYYLGGYLRLLWKGINTAEIFKTPLRERRG